MSDTSPIESFLTRWSTSGAAERAKYQLFLPELCDVLGVRRPQPSTPDVAVGGFVFEKARPRRVEDLAATLAVLGQAHMDGTVFVGTS